MKTVFLQLIISMMLILLMIGNVSAENAFNVGDKACVQWTDDFWYHAEINDVSEDHIRVHYTDYDTSYDEWVRKVTAVPLYTPNINDSAWIFWKASLGNSLFFEGTILEKNSSGYKVHYLSDGEDNTWDEWKGFCDLFPVPKAGDYLWVGPSSSSWAYGEVLEHTGTDEWKVHYGGYSDGGVWYDYTDTFSPPDIVPATPEDQETIRKKFLDYIDIPPPTGSQVYTFDPVVSPDPLGWHYVSNPAKIKPIGLGSVARGGDTMSVSFDLPAFAEEMNVYFALSMDMMPDTILLYGTDSIWHNFSDEGLIPAFEKKNYVPKVDLFENLDISTLPDTGYHFYLLASKGTDLSNVYIWTTSFTKAQLGYFTKKTNSCLSSKSASMAQTIVQEMEAKGSSAFYDALKTYVNQYKDAKGKENPVEALNMIALAAYGENNIYPFCWALFKGLQEDSVSPAALNSAAVCLFELNKIDDAGTLLDCAYRYNQDFSTTYFNGAYYYAEKGAVDDALKAYKTAVQKSPENPHGAWDAYHYAVTHNNIELQNYFRKKIPENYALKNADGTTGEGEKELIVCCNCNGGIYRDLGLCLDECSVSLACFTHICSPRLQCCDGKSPFSFDGGVCYPPGGLQICFETDDKGTVSVKAGVSLGSIWSGHVVASSNFKNNYTIALESVSGGAGKHRLTMLTTDPNTRNWSSQHQLTAGTSFGPLSFSANTEPGNWSKKVLCELYTPPSK